MALGKRPRPGVTSAGAEHDVVAARAGAGAEGEEAGQNLEHASGRVDELRGLSIFLLRLLLHTWVDIRP